MLVSACGHAAERETVDMVQVSSELLLPLSLWRTGRRCPILATVVDASGLPLPGCSVELEVDGLGELVSTGKNVATVRTDREGDALVTWEPARGGKTADETILITAHCEAPRAALIRLAPLTSGSPTLSSN